VPRRWRGWTQRAEGSYRRLLGPFLARLRDDDRAALFRPELFRLALFRLELLRLALLRPALLRPPREDFRVLFRAELRPPRLADLPPRLADFRALFLAPFRADFLLLRLAEPPLDFLRDRLRERLREPLVPLVRLVDAGSSKSKDGDDEGVGDGVLSEGSGSIHPEPDQPISIK
jgi:hypothetical protein